MSVVELLLEKSQRSLENLTGAGIVVHGIEAMLACWMRHHIKLDVRRERGRDKTVDECNRCNTRNTLFTFRVSTPLLACCTSSTDCNTPCNTPTQTSSAISP